MKIHTRRLVDIIVLILAVIFLSWPAFINRGPFFMPDTSAYVRSADSAFVILTGKRTIWSDRLTGYTGSSASNAIRTNAAKPMQVVNKSDDEQHHPLHPPLIGRSVYYGAVIYLPIVLLGESSIPFLQSAFACGLIWIVTRAIIGFPRDPRQVIFPFFLSCLLIAIFTPFAFTVTLVMPDFLSGMELLSTIFLILFWKDLTRWEIIFLSIVVLWGSISHSSHFLMLLALVPVPLFLAKRNVNARKALAIMALAIVATVVGDLAYKSAVARVTGADPIRPPFLTARFIDEGPGYQFAKQVCSRPTFEICHYLNRMPQDSDAFLWSTSEKDGVFSASSLDVQRRVAQQDMPFALATFRHFPAEVIVASLKAGLRQVTLFNLDIYKGNSAQASDTPFWSNLPPPVAQRIKMTAASHGNMPVKLFEYSSIAALILSLLIFIGLFSKFYFNRGLSKDDRRWFLAVILALYGVFVNAALTGALSKPDARYNARIVWIIPTLVAGASIQMMRRRQNGNVSQLKPTREI